DGTRALPALTNRPDDQALAAAHVAAGEYVRFTGLVVVGIGVDIAAVGQGNARLIEQAGLLWPDTPHRQEDQVGPQHEFAAGSFFQLPFRPSRTDAFEAGDLAVLAQYFLGEHGPITLH